MLDFLSELRSGSFGLAKTYWQYGIIVNGFLGVLLGLINSTGLYILTGPLIIIYGFNLSIGVWNAASLYTGSRFWAFLSRLTVPFSLIAQLVFISNYLLLFGSL